MHIHKRKVLNPDFQSRLFLNAVTIFEKSYNKVQNIFVSHFGLKC